MIALVLLTGFVSCKSVREVTGDNSKNVPGWAGTYSGVLPCASCPGIETVLRLNSDMTYRLETTYQDKGSDTYSEEGKFEWNKQGDVVMLKGVDSSEALNRYSVGENRVTMLDVDGIAIKGVLADNYVLHKVSDLEEKYWKLVELNGNVPDYSEGWHREPHMVFRSFDRRVNGNSGCNSFFGDYELKDGSQVSFSSLGATKMACGSNSIEMEFFRLLDGTLDFEVVDDQLTFSKAGKKLARFELVWLY